MDNISCSACVFLLLLSIIREGLSIRCYICSYSPDDRNNRTDKCTEDNFQPLNVYSDDCELGCEVFVQYDANDALEHWRRNCVQNGHKITDDCQSEKTRGWRKVRCTCNRDLCNYAERTGLQITTISATVLLQILCWTLKSRLQ